MCIHVTSSVRLLFQHTVFYHIAYYLVTNEMVPFFIFLQEVETENQKYKNILG